MSIASAERQLEDLAVKIDGRNTHNGYCTWPMIRDTIEQALAEIHDGAPVDPPSLRLSRERVDLEELEDLALSLAARAHAIRLSAANAR